MRGGGVNGKSVAIIFAGGILTYSGVKNLSVSKALRNIIAGKNPAVGATADVTGTADLTTLDSVANTPGYNPGLEHVLGANVPTSSTAARNQFIARAIAAPYGWSTGPQWDALVLLWNQESGWNNTAVNSSSGATGIPQALPATKMPLAAQAPFYDPVSQIGWGLRYIRERYGSPAAAWQHEVDVGWY